MSLRINSNIASINALRQLNKSNITLSKSLQQLSSGLKINAGADDPAGLIIAENLKADITGIEQALENTERAIDLMATTEGALDEVSRMLRDIRGLVLHATNSGGNDPGEIEADQLQIDNTLTAIDRIANSTKYSSRNLLDGSNQIEVTAQSNEISNLHIRSVGFGTAQSATIDIVVATTAQRACASIGETSGALSLRVTGTNGTQVFDFASGTTSADIASTINLFTDNLGLFAATDGAGEWKLLSSDFGSDAFLSVSVVDGTVGDYQGEGGTGSLGTGYYTTGVDMTATVGGAKASGNGDSLTVAGTLFTGEINFTPPANTAADPIYGAGHAVGSPFQFTVQNTGLTFQLGNETDSNDQVVLGIDSVHTSYLGTSLIDGLTTNQNGRLISIRSGGDNDLRTDPNTALKVVDNAINDVSNLRGYLGAFQRNVLEANLNSMNVAFENLTSSESTIRDVDFAKATMEFTRAQILVQAGTTVLSQANLAAQNVLQLLG